MIGNEAMQAKRLERKGEFWPFFACARPKAFPEGPLHKPADLHRPFQRPKGATAKKYLDEKGAEVARKTDRKRKREERLLEKETRENTQTWW